MTSTIAAAPNCAASFIHGRQRIDVVDQAGEEEQRGAGEDAEQLLVRRRTPPTATAATIPAASPSEDPDAAEGRGRVLAPPLAGRVSDEPVGER